jgi:hypothetical protein
MQCGSISGKLPQEEEGTVAPPDIPCFMGPNPPGSAMIHDFANRSGLVLVSFVSV